MPTPAQPLHQATLRQPVSFVTWLLLMGVWVLLIAGSMIFSVSQIHARTTELMREGARNVFHTIVAARQWNADSQGVYVITDKATSANLHLKTPDRDIVTTDGRQLTRINPAYMTRLIAQAIARNSNLQVRIPSLKPINPLNAPDDWEAHALLSFEQGGSEISALTTRADGNQEFRYIAPLKVVASCQNCHSEQSYKIGDVRGGISISQAYAPAAAAARQEIIQTALRHLLVFALLAGLSYALLKQLRRRWAETEQSLNAQVQTEKMASLGRLVTGLAHELDIPISVAVNSISQGKLCSETLSRQLEQDEIPSDALRQGLSSLQHNANQALSGLHRAESLLQGFKHSSLGINQEESRRFDLAELITDTLQPLHDIYQHCAEIEVICPPGTEMSGEPGLLEQIFTNLLRNSVQHGFKDGARQGSIRIEVAALEDNTLRISYADDGAGMSAETLTHVFEPFFSTCPDSNGRGLGLYICYSLVTTRLGGSVRCDSLPGGGTHFLITLPVSLNNPKNQ